MTRYRFDLYPRTDPRDGTLVGSLEELQRAEYRGEANGAGVGLLALRGDSSDGQLIDPAGMQYVRVVADDTDDVVGGFFLDAGSFAAITERHTRLLEFHGAGTLSYTDRETMWIKSYIEQHPAVFGDDPVSDPIGGVWQLWNQGDHVSNGDFLGACLWRVVWEAQHFDTADPDTDRPESAIPDLVLTFDGFEDTDGNPWTLPSGEFTASVGESLYAVIQRIMAAGIYVEMDPDTFELRAWEAAGHRRDRTGGAFGVDVVRFEAGVNIKSDANRQISAFIQRSAILAATSENLAAVVTGTADIPWHGAIREDVGDVAALEQLATAELSSRADAGDTVRLRMKLGDTPASGFYRPWEEVQLDDVVTVDSGAGQWDWNEAEFPVAALEVKLRDEGAWDAFVELGAAFSSAPNREFQASGVPLARIPFCDPSKPCEFLRGSDLTAATATNGDAENSSGTEWSGTGGGYNTSHKRAGARGFGSLSALNPTYTYSFDPSQVFEAGVRYVLDVWVDYENDHDQTTITFGKAGVDTDERAYVGAVGNDPTDLWDESATGADGRTWDRGRVCWTPSADRTGVTVAIDLNSHGPVGFIFVDSLALYTTENDNMNGVSGKVARCDHGHTIASIPGLRTELDELALGAGYTDEQAQDAVGAMIDDTATVALVYADATPALTANVIPAGIKLDDLGTPDDNTDLDATTSEHGLLRKLSNDPTKFLDAQGNWTNPGTVPAASARGIMAYAYTTGHSSTTSPTGANLPANGGSRAAPVSIVAPMYLDSVMVRCLDTSGTRTWGWDLYAQDSSGSPNGTRVASSAADSTFSPGAASNRSIAAASAPVFLLPGTYWIVIQNRHASTTFGMGINVAGNMAVNVAQSKTTTNPNGDPLDLSTGWTRVTSGIAVILFGRVLAEGGPF